MSLLLINRRILSSSRPITTPALTLSLSLSPYHYCYSLLPTMSTARRLSMSDQIKRNPHPDFKKVEASRPEFDSSPAFHYTKTPSTDWQFGSGANTSAGADKKHVAIDPYDADRPKAFNYKLLISAITPRPIAFISTRSADGSSTNLAPFSYFNMINHDPPLFVVGFVGSIAAAKDTLKNVLETKECVINIISEDYVEAANSTAVNTPYGKSEWEISGLTPVYDCQDVKDVPRVKESVFSIEAKLDMVKEYESRETKGKISGTMAIFEGLKFWVREDAVNEEKSIVDPTVLKAVGRLGGITYSRTGQAFEIKRPDYEKDIGGEEGFEKLKENGASK